MIEHKVDFDLLGCKVKATPSSNGIGSHKIISQVSSEIDEIRKQKPLLDDKEVAILIALKYAGKNIELNERLENTVKNIETSLEVIEGIVGESGTNLQ
jgi:hypothetical protein